MSRRTASPPSARDALTPPRTEAVERFRADVARLCAEAPTRIALAVSGGPDSMAMLSLAAAAFPGACIAATFDHQLRAESAAEAAMVASACAALGVPHDTLTSDQPITGSSLQWRARDARYAALTAWAARADADALLTAHHADDQAETLLMRLNRASGLKGLAAIRASRIHDGIVILRPLLGWRRAELRAIVDHCRLPSIDDPSNVETRFDRTRIRALLAGHPELDPTALAASARYLADAEEVLAAATERLWSERWQTASQSFAIGDQPRELQRRLVRRAIDAARAEYGIALPDFTDSANVEPLLDALALGGSAVQGGIHVRVSADGWRFAPAPPRRSH